MIFRYGRDSRREHRTLHPWLQLILLKLLLKHDHSCDQGGRTDQEQWAVFESGASTLHPPDGNHLLRWDPTKQFPGIWSYAVDVTPWIEGRRLATRGKRFGPDQQAQFAFFLGIVKTIADEVLAGTGWELRLGINWDMDYRILEDQSFDDWFHLEIVRKRARRAA